jgi:hypothetical protein
MAGDVEQSWRELEASIEAFRRIARKAVEVAASPTSSRAQYDDARVQTTFALASVGAQLKRVLHAALGDESPPSPGASPPHAPRDPR